MKKVSKPITPEEIKEFKSKWGQKHNEVCRALDYPLPHAASDDLLMVDYFWIEKDRMWYPKTSILYDEREEEIARFLKDSSKNETKTTEQITYEITEVLCQADGKFIEKIANQVLTEQIKYIGNDTFEIIK